MPPQLQEIAAALRAASERLGRLAASVPDTRWPTRNDPARWSVSECIEHLNLTSAAFVPRLEAGLVEARGQAPATRRYRRGFLGWVVYKMTGPDARGRMQTTASFDPAGAQTAEAVQAEFARWQARLLELLASADGLALDAVTLTSPFNTRVRYNLYAAFSIIPQHQHRHLQQAERVWGDS